MRSSHAWALIMALVAVSAIDPAFAQDPFGSITSKTLDARDQVVVIGQAVLGLVAAVLFLMAAFGKVAWHWVGMVVVAGAGLTGIDAIQAWLTS